MPISVAASLSTPPRTSSPSGSVAPATASERERILAAVTRLEPDRATDLTDLLMSFERVRDWASDHCYPTFSSFIIITTPGPLSSARL
jgi:hypothetical protein